MDWVYQDKKVKMWLALVKTLVTLRVPAECGELLVHLRNS